MSNNMRPKWSNSLGFMLAAAGSAIGLGNIWKFPYIVGMNGGGAFVLIYLFCIALIGVPILIAELYIGQKGQANTVVAYENVYKKGTMWKISGWLGLVNAFLILSFYGVIGGWILDFEFRSLLNEFQSLNETEIKGVLGELFNSPWRLLILYFIFSAMTVGIVLGGVQKGIERWNKILMPGLVVILLILLAYSCFLPGFVPALKFLFLPDFADLKWSSILEAVGHSCFTLSVAVGVMITYGSYLSKNENLPKMGIALALIDTILALAAGIVIFSAVYSYDVTAGVGPTLIFQTLPILFAKMPGGYLISVFFFLLVTFTALTSTMSLLEVVVAYCEETFKLPRKMTTLLVGISAFALGILCVLSYNLLSHVKFLGLTFFDLFDKLTSTLFMPVSGLMTALFCGWILGAAVMRRIVAHPGYSWLEKPLLYCIRFITPLSIFIILILGLEWLWG